MSKMLLPIDGHINVPFETLLADPLLILKKFPFVETIEARGPLNYYVVTKPIPITNTLHVRRRWHINLVVEADKIRWVPVEENAHPDCDGWIVGECVAAADGRTRVTLDADVEHRLLNTITSAIYKNAIRQAGFKFLLGFEKNFRDTSFSNTVPVYQA